MNVNVLTVISVTGFVSAFIFGVIAIYLFFRLKVKDIIDDLSGKKAERNIKEYAESNVRVYKDRGSVMSSIDFYGSQMTGTIAYTTKLESMEETTFIGNQLILNEMVIHTEERI